MNELNPSQFTNLSLVEVNQDQLSGMFCPKCHALLEQRMTWGQMRITGAQVYVGIVPVLYEGSPLFVCPICRDEKGRPCVYRLVGKEIVVVN